ncbi:MAG: type II toxin-antitoxin system VapC family toxin [Sphingomonadales bacterium]
MFLLDTNIISETRKPRPNPGLSRWIAEASPLDLYISVLSVGEIRKGVEKLRQHNARNASEIEEWLTDIEDAFAERVLPIDRRIAHAWGRLSARAGEHPVDVMLASTAQVHDLTLVTRNVRDVAELGIAMLNPFSA